MNVEIIFKKISIKMINGVEQQKIFNEANTPVVDFCNNLAIFAAKRFLNNNDTYTECDIAMNNLNAFMLSNEEIFNTKFPEPALSIYFGFDEGEYYHSKDSKSIDPVKKYTLPILKKIIEELEYEDRKK